MGEKGVNVHGLPNVEYEKIEISVDSSGKEIEFSHITEIDHNCIIGIAQVFSNIEALPNSTLRLEIDSQEVFPKGFESKMIFAGDDVPPDDRFIRTVNRDVKQDRITGKFTDGGALEGSFVPYTANIYLMVLSNRH